MADDDILPTGLNPTATPAVTPPKMPETGIKGASAANPYGEADVASAVAKVTSESSPLMQQARTDGLKMANRRGLINSSMAAGAAQSEALRVAVPIGAQQAAQTHQRNVSDQNFQQEGLLQERRIGSAEGMQAKDIASAEKRAADEIRAREEMLGRQLTSEELRQVKDIASRKDLLTQELGVRQEMLGEELSSRERLQTAEFQHLTGERALDRALQEKIADWNVKSSEKAAAAQLAAATENTYAAITASMLSNPNIDYRMREEMMEAAEDGRDASLKSAESLFGLSVNGWCAAATPAIGAVEQIHGLGIERDKAILVAIGAVDQPFLAGDALRFGR